MTRSLAVLLLSLLIIMPASPAFAQDVLAKKVTIDVNAASPVSVFTAVATASGGGFTVTVDPAVTDPVDITVRNVSVKTALNAICESIDCQWTLRGNALVVRPKLPPAMMIGVAQPGGRGTPVDKDKAAWRAQVVLKALKQKLPADMRFENAPLGEINRRLSEALQMSVELSCKEPSVQKLTMDFSNLSLQSALQALVEGEAGAHAAWRLTIGSQPGDAETPTIAIMVGPRPSRKK